MITVGVVEARNKLSALLDRVEHGEAVMLTRRGKPVARLVANGEVTDPSQVQDALQRMRARSSQIRPGTSIGTTLKEIETQAGHKTSSTGITNLIP
jgi:prevent-host-death family protein